MTRATTPATDNLHLGKRTVRAATVVMVSIRASLLCRNVADTSGAARACSISPHVRRAGRIVFRLRPPRATATAYTLLTPSALTSPPAMVNPAQHIAAFARLAPLWASKRDGHALPSVSGRGDVLGMASLCGGPCATIANAAQRAPAIMLRYVVIRKDPSRSWGRGLSWRDGG